jgi:hypothetical protein
MAARAISVHRCAELIEALTGASPLVQYLSTDAERLLVGTCSCCPMALMEGNAELVAAARPSWTAPGPAACSSGG